MRALRVQTRGAFAFASRARTGALPVTESRLTLTCARVRVCTRWGTHGWDETMRQSQNVTKFVYVYAWPRASAPIPGRSCALDVDIDNRGARLAQVLVHGAQGALYVQTRVRELALALALRCPIRCYMA
jgi:hypothetical protein